MKKRIASLFVLTLWNCYEKRHNEADRIILVFGVSIPFEDIWAFPFSKVHALKHFANNIYSDYSVYVFCVMRYEIMPDVVNEGKFVFLRDRHLRLSNSNKLLLKDGVIKALRRAEERPRTKRAISVGCVR
jgi:hypothetical protein